MAIVDTPRPTFDIHKSAKPYITDAYFDDAYYVNYLLSRGVTEERLASLALTVTNEGISPFAIANFDHDGDNALIRFSARRMPRDIGKQNGILFHETEHFIWEENHPYTQSVKAALIMGSLTVGSMGGAGIMGHEAFNATEGLPMVIRGVASLSAGVIGGVAGGVTSVFTANNFYQQFSTNEIKARRAAKQEVKDNSGVLRIVWAR